MSDLDMPERKRLDLIAEDRSWHVLQTASKIYARRWSLASPQIFQSFSSCTRDTKGLLTASRIWDFLLVSPEQESISVCFSASKMAYSFFPVQTPDTRYQVLCVVYSHWWTQGNTSVWQTQHTHSFWNVRPQTRVWTHQFVHSVLLKCQMLEDWDSSLTHLSIPVSESLVQ